MYMAKSRALFFLIFLFFFNANNFSFSRKNELNKINYFFLNFDTTNDIIFNELNENQLDFLTYASVHYNVKNESAANNESINLKEETKKKYIPDSLFRFANQSRFTITGELPYVQSYPKLINIAALTGIFTGIFYVQHLIQQSDVWKETGPFHIQEDIQYALWVDKLGHFYGGYATSYLFTEAFITSGFGWEISNVLGSLMGLGYMSYIEVLDGYSKGFGFSPTDYYFDILGSGFFLAQYYFPILQNFNPKFMYVNPKWLGEKDRSPHESFIDNYSAQTFWMSVNIQNLFGGIVAKYIPEWLELSIGYAAYSLCYPPLGNCDNSLSEPVSNDAWGNRKIIISLDYNLVKLLPDGPPFWNWLKQSLKLFKLPAPALEIGKATKFYIIYPFRF